jgi:hypothetical protein
MPVRATIHFRPMELENSGRQQEQEFLEEEAEPLMGFFYRRRFTGKQQRRNGGVNGDRKILPKGERKEFRAGATPVK